VTPKATIWICKQTGAGGAIQLRWELTGHHFKKSISGRHFDGRVTHGRERNSVRQDKRAGVVADGNGGVERLRGKICQRSASAGAVRIVKRQDAGAGIPVSSGTTASWPLLPIT
jgi:hypothetical protein